MDLIFQIDINWKPSRMWGATPHAEVTAYIPGVRCDITHGSASGIGYDKRSAAVDNALRENPLMQTLLLWDEFSAQAPYGEGCHRALRKRDYGYALRFGGMGMDELRSLLKQSGFECIEMHGDAYDGYRFWRDMPESFMALV